MQIFANITILIFVPHIFADTWITGAINITQYNPLTGVSLSCKDWLLLSGFDEYDSVENIQRAKGRNINLEGTAFFWAVIFAHFIIAFPKYGEHALFTPEMFCIDHGMRRNNMMQFEAFESKEMTCSEWIVAYGYIEDFWLSNKQLAEDRNIDVDGAISLWASLYARYATRKGENISNSIDGFCIGVVNPSRTMKFMSLDGSTKPCSEWVTLYGFIDVAEKNVMKVKSEKYMFRIFHIYMNKWARLYFEYLLMTAKKRNTFFLGCASSSQTKEYPGGATPTPSDFCIYEGYTEPVTYFH